MKIQLLTLAFAAFVAAAPAPQIPIQSVVQATQVLTQVTQVAVPTQVSIPTPAAPNLAPLAQSLQAVSTLMFFSFCWIPRWTDGWMNRWLLYFGSSFI